MGLESAGRGVNLSAADASAIEPTAEAGAGRWRVCRFTVVGPAHLVDGRPNQDALDVRPRHSGADSQIVSAAVADGHGHPSHCRSAVGAKLAAAALADALVDVSVQVRGLMLDRVEDLLRRDLIEQLTRTWREAVAADLREDPPASRDYAALASQLTEDDLTRATLVPIYQYGTTALGVAGTPEWMLVGGIGDGDVVVIDADLTATCPLSADDSTSANLTASLCQPDPAGSWRAAALPRTMDGRRPIIALVATDGVTGGMSRQVLCREAERLARSLVSEGHDEFERVLWQFVGEAQRILGDDATVVALYEERAVERLRTRPHGQDEPATRPCRPAQHDTEPS